MNDNLNLPVMRLLASSRRAQWIARNAQAIRKGIERDQRAILPVAFLAREFSVSLRLLWNWIKKGMLKEEKPSPKVKLKPGVSRKGAIRFLRLLEEISNDCVFNYSWRPGGRPAVRKEKIRQAQTAGIRGNGMIPREYAELIGISRSSVMRSIKDHSLDSWRPTPSRYRIGRKPRSVKKRK